jgi:signal transduction histidine kinase
MAHEISTPIQFEAVAVSVAAGRPIIPRTIRQRIGAPFFAAKTDVGCGNVLGLAIVCTIVAKHRINFWFDTEVEGGTTLQISLPFQPGQSPATSTT